MPVRCQALGIWLQPYDCHFRFQPTDALASSPCWGKLLCLPLTPGLLAKFEPSGTPQFS